MNIENIEKHREEKILSLLKNRLDFEKILFFEALDKLKVSEVDKRLIKKALRFSVSQNYGSGELYNYYACHPVRVARLGTYWLSMTNRYNIDFIICCLIHNVIEKEILTFEEIQSSYGIWCAKVIRVLTVDRSCQKQLSWSKSYYSQINSLDVYGRMVKVFDKFDNIYAICLNPDKMTRYNYIDEIKLYIQPLIEKNAPYLANYFDNLISSSEKIGYKSGHLFLEDFS